MKLSGTQDKRILLIIRANTTEAHITKQIAHGIYIKLILPWYYQEQQGQAL
jgi:hypothetical protein